MTLITIKNLNFNELRQWLTDNGQPAFRAEQVFNWLYRKWVVDFNAMRNIPKSLRLLLDENFTGCSLELVDTQLASDGTEKFLYRLQDGEKIETVLIKARDRRTVCVSTQVGCPVRCSFCASGKGGLVRDLQPAEIVDQVVLACRHFEERVSNIVIMGMGEPLLNYRNLEKALDLIDAPEGLGIGARRITVSTSGIPGGIRRLANSGRQWNLALSLHATTDIQRARLIPAPYRYPLHEILEACRYYYSQTNRMVTLEYTLLHGRNCDSAAAERLVQIATDLHAKVNLIPYNQTVSRHKAPEDDEIRKFLEILARKNVNFTVRHEKGADIQAACGQLRQSAENYKKQ
ncbi:MAG: 23S rRNA (adenine(2503)-C(2))-methyltransferase RlmN [Lentisphaeria bacterium]